VAAPRPTRPTRADLEAARDELLPDVLPGPDDPPLRVLFSGINPGLVSAYTGHHFARPGNRFWPALHAGGFTPRVLRPAEQHLLPGLGLGITNVVPRATARADELSDTELRAGGERLRILVRTHRPDWLAVVGIGAYRVAFADRTAAVGRQDTRVGDTAIWVLPNPSGLNAHYTPASLAEAFAELHAAVGDSIS
jgi:double-stranded uracil-DNA glycosylase